MPIGLRGFQRGNKCAYRCIKVDPKIWRIKNRKRLSLYLKNYNLKRKYNITLEEYNKLLELQHYRCAICVELFEDTHAFICLDHSHKTGKQRGLICRRCNLILGNCKDSIKILKRAIVYLKKYSI